MSYSNISNNWPQKFSENFFKYATYLNILRIFVYKITTTKTVPADSGKTNNTTIMNIKEMTVEHLVELKSQIEEELSLRESQGNGFYKEFCLEGKAYRPATHKQYLFAESLAKKTDSVIEVTTSQICKRMEMDEMSEAIELMKEGKRIRIYQ